MADRGDIDEVVALGARLGAAMKREDELMDKAMAARRKKSLSGEVYFDRAVNHSTDETDAIRDTIAMTKARTLSGAAIQIAEAMCRIERVWDEFPEGEAGPETKRDIRAIERLLFSALDLIEEKAGRKVDELVHDGFASRNLDPWVAVEGRLKEIEAEAAQATKASVETGDNRP